MRELVPVDDSVTRSRELQWSNFSPWHRITSILFGLLCPVALNAQCTSGKPIDPAFTAAADPKVTAYVTAGTNVESRDGKNRHNPGYACEAAGNDSSQTVETVSQASGGGAAASSSGKITSAHLMIQATTTPNVIIPLKKFSTAAAVAGATIHEALDESTSFSRTLNIDATIVGSAANPTTAPYADVTLRVRIGQKEILEQITSSRQIQLSYEPSPTEDRSRALMISIQGNATNGGGFTVTVARPECHDSPPAEITDNDVRVNPSDDDSSRPFGLQRQCRFGETYLKRVRLVLNAYCDGKNWRGSLSGVVGDVVSRVRPATEPFEYIAEPFQGGNSNTTEQNYCAQVQDLGVPFPCDPQSCTDRNICIPKARWLCRSCILAHERVHQQEFLQVLRDEINHKKQELIASIQRLTVPREAKTREQAVEELQSQRIVTQWEQTLLRDAATTAYNRVQSRGSEAEEERIRAEAQRKLAQQICSYAARNKWKECRACVRIDPLAPPVAAGLRVAAPNACVLR